MLGPVFAMSRMPGQDEILIIKLLPIDGLATCVVLACEGTRVKLPPWNDSVKAGNFMTKSFLPSVQGTKVFCCLWNFICKQLGDMAQGLSCQQQCRNTRWSGPWLNTGRSGWRHLEGSLKIFNDFFQLRYHLHRVKRTDFKSIVCARLTNVHTCHQWNNRTHPAPPLPFVRHRWPRDNTVPMSMTALQVCLLPLCTLSNTV